jgi:hypothetical protein
LVQIIQLFRWHATIYIYIYIHTYIERERCRFRTRLGCIGRLQQNYLWDPRRWKKERNPLQTSEKKWMETSPYKEHTGLLSWVGNGMLREWVFPGRLYCFQEESGMA